MVKFKKIKKTKKAKINIRRKFKKNKKIGGDYSEQQSLESILREINDELKDVEKKIVESEDNLKKYQERQNYLRSTRNEINQKKSLNTIKFITQKEYEQISKKEKNHGNLESKNNNKQNLKI